MRFPTCGSLRRPTGKFSLHLLQMSSGRQLASVNLGSDGEKIQSSHSPRPFAIFIIVWNLYEIISDVIIYYISDIIWSYPIYELSWWQNSHDNHHHRPRERFLASFTSELTRLSSKWKRASSGSQWLKIDDKDSVIKTPAPLAIKRHRDAPNGL